MLITVSSSMIVNPFAFVEVILVLLNSLNIITIVRGNETPALYGQYTLWDALCQSFLLLI